MRTYVLLIIMKGGGRRGLHLTALKVKQLQEELVAWAATKSGCKRALQLRLRALIIAAVAECEGTEPEAAWRPREGDFRRVSSCRRIWRFL